MGWVMDAVTAHSPAANDRAELLTLLEAALVLADSMELHLVGAHLAQALEAMRSEQGRPKMDPST